MHGASRPFTLILAVHLVLFAAGGRAVHGADDGHSHPPISEEDIDESQIIDLDTFDTSDEGYDIRRLDRLGTRR
ncbi:MAG: hypothetical protein LIQ31_16215, partial [Planctomycetes bacterium]|nr:hypothetical protein [Planctomycetota bacterium]